MPEINCLTFYRNGQRTDDSVQTWPFRYLLSFLLLDTCTIHPHRIFGNLVNEFFELSDNREVANKRRGCHAFAARFGYVMIRHIWEASSFKRVNSNRQEPLSTYRDKPTKRLQLCLIFPIYLESLCLEILNRNHGSRASFHGCVTWTMLGEHCGTDLMADDQYWPRPCVKASPEVSP